MYELNLIPEHLKKKKRKLTPITIIFFLLLCMVFTAGILVPKYYLIKLHHDEKELLQEIEKGRHILLESERMQKEIKNYKQYIDNVSKLTQPDYIVTEVIKRLETYIVEDIIVTNMTYGDGVMDILVEAKEYASICIFIANIQEAKAYPQAKISDIIQNKEGGNYTCSINIIYEEVLY